MCLKAGEVPTTRRPTYVYHITHPHKNNNSLPGRTFEDVPPPLLERLWLLCFRALDDVKVRPARPQQCQSIHPTKPTHSSLNLN